MAEIDNDRDEPSPHPASPAGTVWAGTVLASAPVRTADVGGWTDTWFARTGVVCNIAIDHRAQVRVDVDPTAHASIELEVQLTGERYGFEASAPPGKHPMLEAAAAALAPSCGVKIQVARTIEGSGLGTSSAVLVALVAALRVAAGGQIDPADVAAAAHRFETGSGREAGVQDHIAAAFGGVSLITVDYPHAHRQAVSVSQATLAELDRRLITVWLGRSHESSAMHDEVIARLASEDAPKALDCIREAARMAAEALVRDDLDAYGAALVHNHDALDGLHPALVCDDARSLVELARSWSASGWKTLGAGGPGGSMVVLGAADRDQCALLRQAVDRHPRWQCIDAPLARDGVHVRRCANAEARP